VFAGSSNVPISLFVALCHVFGIIKTEDLFYQITLMGEIMYIYGTTQILSGKMHCLLYRTGSQRKAMGVWDSWNH
jgi:hypothetical protein